MIVYRCDHCLEDIRQDRMYLVYSKVKEISGANKSNQRDVLESTMHLCEDCYNRYENNIN